MDNTTSHGGQQHLSPLASRSQATFVLETTLGLLFNGVALLGNLLVCTAIYRNSRLRTVTGFFMLSLAVSDVLMATTCMPLSVGATMIGEWVYGHGACQFQGYLINTLAAVSLHTMGLTAIHRYFRVVRPEKCRKLFTKKRTIFVISCVWLTVLFVPALEMAVGAIEFDFNEGKVICFIDNRNKELWLANLSAFVAVNMILPMMIMFICYFKVFQRVRQHKVGVTSSFNRTSFATTLQQHGNELDETLHRKSISIETGACTQQGGVGKRILVHESNLNLGNTLKEGKEETSEACVERLQLNYEPQRKRSAKYEAANSEIISQPRSSISDWLPQPMTHLETFSVDQHRCSIVSQRSQSLGTTLPSYQPAYAGNAPTLFHQRNSIAIVTQRRASVVDWLNQQKELLSTSLNKTRVNVPTVNSQLKTNVEEIKITTILFVVVLGFMLCWFPILVISIYTMASPDQPLPRGVDVLYTFLGATSSAINPCIYGLMNRSFRSEYLKIIRCKRQRKV